MEIQSGPNGSLIEIKDGCLTVETIEDTTLDISNNDMHTPMTSVSPCDDQDSSQIEGKQVINLRKNKKESISSSYNLRKKLSSKSNVIHSTHTRDAMDKDLPTNEEPELPVFLHDGNSSISQRSIPFFLNGGSGLLEGEASATFTPIPHTYSSSGVDMNGVLSPSFAEFARDSQKPFHNDSSIPLYHPASSLSLSSFTTQFKEVASPGCTSSHITKMPFSTLDPSGDKGTDVSPYPAENSPDLSWYLLESKPLPSPPQLLTKEETVTVDDISSLCVIKDDSMLVKKEDEEKPETFKNQTVKKRQWRKKTDGKGTPNSDSYSNGDESYDDSSEDSIVYPIRKNSRMNDNTGYIKEKEILIKEEREVKPVDTKMVHSTHNAPSVNHITYGNRHPCNCKKSRCLKLYCECFSSNIYCSGCNCTNCHNNKEYMKEREEAKAVLLSRNSNAFKPHVICNGDVPSINLKGCNCRKTGCLKKYCDCFQAGILCGQHCKCIDCKNVENKPNSKSSRSG